MSLLGCIHGASEMPSFLFYQLSSKPLRVPQSFTALSFRIKLKGIFKALLSK